MSWTLPRLQTALAKGDFAPVYLFYGDETFLIDDTLELLKNKALGDGLEDFNLDTFYGTNQEMAQVRDAIETLPMMAERRIVILKEAHDLKEKDWNTLWPVLQNPVDSTVFVCVMTKVDKRKKNIKVFAEKGVSVEFTRPYENQIQDWIHRIAKRHRVTIEADAASLLQQLVGTYLSDINNEILKLSQYLGYRSEITFNDVLQVVSRSRIENVFELATAIGQQDRVRALVCLAHLLEHGQNEVGVLAMVHRHLKILRLVKQGWKDGLVGARLSARAGIPPYFLRQYEDQARIWNDKKLELGFRALLDTDRALKSSPVSSHIWLENFILQTCV